MSILPATDTIPEFPVLAGSTELSAPDSGWQVCRTTTLDEVSDILDHLENLGVREIQLDRRGNGHFEILWRS